MKNQAAGPFTNLQIGIYKPAYLAVKNIQNYKK